MISLSLAARSMSRPAVSGAKLWTNSAALRATRFLSSKKTDGETTEEAIAAPSKKSIAAAIKQTGGSGKIGAVSSERKATRSKKSNESPAGSQGKYLPMSELPKPPREITDMPLDQLYRKVYLRDDPDKPVITPSNVFAYKFEIPEQFVKTKTNQHSSSFEPAHNIVEFRSGADSSSMLQALDHPLKESITGMFISNPSMVSIDNDFLWDLYPKGKVFDNAPFGGDPSFNGFKNWEKAENDKFQEKEARFESKLNELKEFDQTLNESKSFYRKPTSVAAEKKTAAATQSSDKTGGRRKLDRGLLKQYRKYKKEGWLRRRQDRDDEDDE